MIVPIVNVTRLRRTQVRSAIRDQRHESHANDSNEVPVAAVNASTIPGEREGPVVERGEVRMLEDDAEHAG
jgi:hypothetical protein